MAKSKKMSLDQAAELWRLLMTTRKKAEAIIQEWAQKNGQSEQTVVQMLKQAGLDIKKLPMVLLLALTISFTASAQNVYHLKYYIDIPVAAVGLGTFTSAYIIGKKTDAPNLMQIHSLDKEDIWGVDRSATNRWSPRSDVASDVFLYTSLAMPGLLFINKNVRHEKFVSLIYVETMLLNIGVTSLVKEVSHRYRPFVYNESVGDEMKTSKDAHRSFFSGHTSLAATSCFFMAKVFSDLNPNSRFKPLVWTSAFVLPAVVGVLRYTAGKHYPTDILVGYITGAAIGYLVPHLHTKKEPVDIVEF